MACSMTGNVWTLGALAFLLGMAPLNAQTTATGAAVVKTVSASAVAPQKGMVWVNTASGVYHREGSRSYGKTKQGRYMTEADALKAGYHLAKGETKP